MVLLLIIRIENITLNISAIPIYPVLQFVNVTINKVTPKYNPLRISVLYSMKKNGKVKTANIQKLFVLPNIVIGVTSPNALISHFVNAPGLKIHT